MSLIERRDIWFVVDLLAALPLIWTLVAPRGDMAMPAGQIDMATTLLALMGIDPAPLPLMGRNLLGNLTTDVVVRPNGRWTDGRLFFDGETPNPARRCYDIVAHDILPIEECEKGGVDAALKRKVSRLVLSYDLQSSLVR